MSDFRNTNDKIIENLEKYGDIVKPGYGIGYNAASKNQNEFTKENYLRWAAYDAANDKPRSQGFIEEDLAKELGYKIKKDSIPLVLEKFEDGKAVESNLINLADLSATKNVKNPISEKEIVQGDTDEAYTRIGDKLEALKINRMPGDTGNAEEIRQQIFNYAKKQQIEGKDGKQEVSITTAALAASLFMRKNGILPPADKPLLNENQINYLKEKPSRLATFIKQANDIVDKIDRKVYVYQHPEQYRDLPRNEKAAKILKSKDFKQNGWKNLSYLYITKPPKGISPEEHNVNIVKNMIEDGRTEAQMSTIVMVAGNKIPLKDILKSNEIKEFRNELKTAAREQKQEKAMGKAQAMAM